MSWLSLERSMDKCGYLGTEEETIATTRKMINLLAKGGILFSDPEARSWRRFPPQNLLDSCFLSRTAVHSWTSTLIIYLLNALQVFEANSKRKILEVINSIFDSLGLIAPVVILEIFPSDIWRLNGMNHYRIISETDGASGPQISPGLRNSLVKSLDT